MSHMSWFKLVTEKWLQGSIRNEPLEYRAIWIDLLALAADLDGAGGIIQVANGVPLLPTQLAQIIGCSLELLEKALSHFEEIGMISRKNGLIKIENWKKYQSEYLRQKPYREASGENCNQKLQQGELQQGELQQGELQRGKLQQGKLQTDIDRDIDRDIEKEKERENKEKEKEIPPSIKIYEKIMNQKPPRGLYSTIDRDVGDDPEKLKHWENTCQDWLGHGWNIKNIHGLLEKFRTTLPPPPPPPRAPLPELTPEEVQEKREKVEMLISSLSAQKKLKGGM